MLPYFELHAPSRQRQDLQALLADKRHVTTDPREADLFLVPAMFCALLLSGACLHRPHTLTTHLWRVQIAYTALRT